MNSGFPLFFKPILGFFFHCLPRPPEKQFFTTDGATVPKEMKIEIKIEIEIEKVVTIGKLEITHVSSFFH